jgi:hypothetical protein
VSWAAGCREPLVPVIQLPARNHTLDAEAVLMKIKGNEWYVRFLLSCRWTELYQLCFLCLCFNCCFVTLLTRWYATPFYCTIKLSHTERVAPQRQTLELLAKKKTTRKRAAMHDDFCISKCFCCKNYLKMKVQCRYMLFIDFFVYFVLQFVIQRYKD